MESHQQMQQEEDATLSHHHRHCPQPHPDPVAADEDNTMSKQSKALAFPTNVSIFSLEKQLQVHNNNVHPTAAEDDLASRWTTGE